MKTKALFVTGTGTDVGKTYVTGLMVKKLREMGASAAYYKAAMSGNARGALGSLLPGDALFVKELADIEQPVDTMCPFVYERAVSPHLASRLEGNPVRRQVVAEGFKRLQNEFDYITVEGSGGILCPLCFDEEKLWLEDVINDLDLACLIVADAGLGTINHVALTAYYMKLKHIPVKGIILNRFHSESVLEQDNLKMCEYLTGLPVVACVQEKDTELAISASALASLYE